LAFVFKERCRSDFNRRKRSSSLFLIILERRMIVEYLHLPWHLLMSLKKYGIDISQAEARKPMGMFKKDHIRAILEIPEVQQRWQKKFGKKSTEEDVVKLFDDFFPMQTSCLSKYADLIPGAKETADSIRKNFGVKIGSTTGFSKKHNDILFEYAKKQGYHPDVWITASEVERARPYWYMVHENMEKAGITDPEEVLKVGDTKMDMQEAKALAILNKGVPWTCGLATTGNYVAKQWAEIVATPGDKLLEETRKAANVLWDGGADYVVNTINDVPRIIEICNERLARGEKPRTISLNYLIPPK